MDTNKMLKQAECDPGCGFLVRSEDEKEIREVMKNHAQNVHHSSMTDEEVDKMVMSA